jgi:hypothetical protein
MQPNFTQSELDAITKEVKQHGTRVVLAKLRGLTADLWVDSMLTNADIKSVEANGCYVQSIIVLSKTKEVKYFLAQSSIKHVGHVLCVTIARKG